MLYTRYANPKELISMYVKQRRFGEFVDNVINKENQRRQKEAEKENEQKLWAVVEFLLENETMSGKQFVQCMKGETIEGGSSTAMFDDFTETEE